MLQKSPILKSTVKSLPFNWYYKDTHFNNNEDLMSNLLPDGDLKLSMPEFEISRKQKIVP